MEAIGARDAETPPTPTPTPKPTLGENFVSIAELIKTVKFKTRLSEQTLVKLWELNLMWALNNRQTTSTDIFPGEEGEAVESEAPDLPEPNERITGTPDEA
jgi:hypothetical protein